MRSLDLRQLCKDLSFVCQVTLRYLGLRPQHLNLIGHNVSLTPYKGSEVRTHRNVWMKGWPSWLPGVNPGARTAGCQGRSQITWGLMGL